MTRTGGNRNCQFIQNTNMLTMSRTITDIITLYEHCDTTARRCNEKWGLRVRKWRRIAKSKGIEPGKNYLHIHSFCRTGVPLPVTSPEMSGAKANLAVIYWLTFL